MGLYVEVRKKENELPITNATFMYYDYHNYRNGVYYYAAPVNYSASVFAAGRYRQSFYTGYLLKVWVWLVKKPEVHNKSHSSGWT